MLWIIHLTELLFKALYQVIGFINSQFPGFTQIGQSLCIITNKQISEATVEIGLGKIRINFNGL